MTANKLASVSSTGMQASDSGSQLQGVGPVPAHFILQEDTFYLGQNGYIFKNICNDQTHNTTNLIILFSLNVKITVV